MMRTPKITNNPLLTLIKSYWQWKWVWIATTILFGGLGATYALALKKDTWIAAQGLIVRDEANGGVMRLGRFQSQTDMKAAQETVLEMARNPQVLRAALRKVGRDPASVSTATPIDAPPTVGEIEALAKEGIEVRAPRGAELGTTEVIYLDAKASTPERAIALNIAVCDELEKHLQLVRHTRADGVIDELQTATNSARESLSESTAKLKAIEEAAGADLSDLRSLTDSNSGGSATRQLLDSVKNELLSIELQQRQLDAEFRLASEALETPERLFAAPAILPSQNPAILKLREGLAAASIETSTLRGRYTSQHPRVIAALETEVEIKEQLRHELALAVTSLEQDLTITTARVNQLTKQRSELESSLESLASVRANYGNVVREVAARNEQLQQSEFELAQAVASRNAASTSSLVARLDQPIVGDTPTGPGRTTIIAGATLAGLMFGCGIVFLLSPFELQSTGFGRRATDAFGLNRRGSDQVRVAATELEERRASPGSGAQGWVERRSRPRIGADRRASESPSAANDPTALPEQSEEQSAVATDARIAKELLGGIGELSFSQHATRVMPKCSTGGKTACTSVDDREGKESSRIESSDSTTDGRAIGLPIKVAESTPVAGLTGR